MTTTAVCLAWSAVELLSGALMWAIIFGAAGLYLAWQFFVVFSPPSETDEAP